MINNKDIMNNSLQFRHPFSEFEYGYPAMASSANSCTTARSLTDIKFPLGFLNPSIVRR